MAEFMTVENNIASCPVTSCDVYKDGVKYVPYPVYVRTKADTGNSFNLLIMTNYNPVVKAGWTENKLTVKCHNGETESMTTAEFSVTQAANPCRDTLTSDQLKVPADRLEKLAIPYDDFAISKKAWTENYDFTAAFTNTESGDDCKETCMIFKKDCSGFNPSGAARRFMPDVADDKKLSVYRNFAEGWEEEMCLKCANKDIFATVQFKAKQIFRCNDRITKNTLVARKDDAVIWYTDSKIWHDYITDV